jgi:hypothetical protein
MRRGKTRTLAGMRITAIAMLSVVVATAACGEVREVAYPSLADAVNDGAINRGWVPAWLPKTARDLKEKHDLDTNSSILRFEYSEPAMWTPPKDCTQIGPREATKARLSSSWWPSDVPPRSTVTHRHAYFTCGRGTAFLALTSSEGLYWRP